MTKDCWGIAIFAVTMFAALEMFAAPPNGYYEVWGDEFNGTSLDTTKWDYWLAGSRRDAVNISSAVSVGGGLLTITTFTSNNVNYTSIIGTDNTFRSRYGYWESSIKWGDTNGMWSAFWFQSPTMGSYLYDPFISGSEIDVVEHRSTDGVSNGDIMNQVQNNVHWNGYGSSAASAGSGNIGSGLGSGFHTYGFLWTTTDYTIYIDGTNVRNWDYSNNGVPVSKSTEWVALSSEVDDTSTTWAGTIPAGGYGTLASSTTKLTVDYVRYYAPTTMLYWTGANSTVLSDSANYISNLPPAAVSDITFSTLSGNNLSPTLTGDMSVDGLIFLWLNNGASVGGANTLAIGAGGIDMVAANHTININCPVNIGAAQTWSVGPNSPGNTLMVNGPISGSAALSKASWGTLILNGTNTFSGTLNVDTGATSATGDGIVRITRSENVMNVPTIAIRNNNSAWSTLQLTNLLNNLVIPSAIALNGRNTNVVSIENLSGSNTLSGGITINVGGGFYPLQSDGAGTLNLGGTISSAATGTRTLTLQGNGNFYVSGSIQNGSAGTIILAKTNAGTLTIAGNSTFSGSTTNYRGNIFINGTLNSSLTVVSGLLGGVGTINGAAMIQSGSTLAPGSSGAGALVFGNSLTLLSGSTNYFELNKSQQTNDTVTVAGAVSFNGALIVTNLSGNLAAGDGFKLFTAGSYSGNFSSVKLPSLNYGLAWNTNSLTNGVLSVVATVSPQINSFNAQTGGNFVLTGRSAAWQTNELDAVTNLVPPIAWLYVTSAVADVNGNFQLIDMLATNFPQRFYRLKTQ